MGWNVPRYPVAALVAHCGLSENQLRATVGASSTRWKEAKAKGVTEQTADRLATRAGAHPFEVWPELTAAVVAEAEAVEEARRERRRERQREWKRRRYQNDPEYREKEKAAARRYGSEAADYRRARAKAYYEANREREKARAKAYYEANRERVQAREKANYEANREQRVATQRAYRERKRAAS